MNHNTPQIQRPKSQIGKLAEGGRAFSRAGATLLGVDSLTKPGPPLRLDYAGWTYCATGRFPELVARCRLRVRVGDAIGDAAVVEEVLAYYDPVGWLLESGARISPDRAFAWRLAE
jgi:hypothetical protein